MLLGSIGWYDVFFWLFAATTCGFAALVLFSENVVRMAFFLVLSLGSASGLFFLAGAEFVGAMQLMIYVGGTLVLLIFGVMLTAQQRFITMKTNSGEWVLALIVGSALLLLLLRAGFSVADWNTVNPQQAQLGVEESKTAARIGAALAGARLDRLDEPDPVLRAGMSGYLMPFVIVSVHLLVVLVGAAYMARTRRARSHHGQSNLMTPLFAEITTSHYLAVGAVLFTTGVLCMATKRNALGVLMGIELVLNGANINFVAFGSKYLRPESLGLDGHMMALFVIILAAAEAAVALAIALNFYNNHNSIDVDRGDDLKG